MSIKIPSSTKKFDDEFSIDEDSISIHLKKNTKDANNSFAELRDWFFEKRNEIIFYMLVISILLCMECMDELFFIDIF